MNGDLNLDNADNASITRVRCLEVLAASLVHELTQPLSAVSMSAEKCVRMLTGDIPNLEAAREMAQLALHSANRAAAVLHRMWSLFAKAGRNDEWLSLNDTATEALALSSDKLQECRVIVRRDLQTDLPRISGDRWQLQQVVLNLVSNAADAMSEIHDRPRELLVRTQVGAGQVQLTVRDVGQGFEPSEAERLFDAFFTTKSEGMGIGLFISRWIIENHGGAMHAALNDGPGATFSFVVPCRES